MTEHYVLLRMRRLTEDVDGHIRFGRPMVNASRIRPRVPPATGNIFARRADGGGEEERLTSGASQQVPEAWSQSPVGQVLAWNESSQTTGRPRPLVASRYSETMAQFSPDGRWLAYVSNSSGRDEVFVRSFPDDASPLQVTSEGRTQPLWSRTAASCSIGEAQR